MFGLRSPMRLSEPSDGRGQAYSNLYMHGRRKKRHFSVADHDVVVVLFKKDNEEVL